MYGFYKYYIVWGVALLLPCVIHVCQCFRASVGTVQIGSKYWYTHHRIGWSGQTNGLASAATATHLDGTLKNAVKIFDSVYDAETCLLLHKLAKEHADQIGDDSSIFRRNHQRHRTRSSSSSSSKNKSDGENPDNCTDHRQMTPLEYAIDDILTNICNDTTTNIVEYWSRQDYINMDVHCDVDEKLLEKKKRFLRCPEYAHILYLVVQLPTNVTAPTCIFPTKRGGWLTTTNSNHGNNTENGTVLNHTQMLVDLIVVPAVTGRVVRFPGAIMHAVPKRSDQWFTSTRTEVESTFDRHCDDDEDGEEEGEYDGNNQQIELRSVLLFNCWSNDMPPPMGLKKYNYFDDAHRPTDVPDGIVIDDVFDDEQMNDTFNKSLRHSEESISFDKCTFAIEDHWKTTPITSFDQPDPCPQTTTTLSVRLMGNKYRRQHNKAVTKLYINKHNEPALVQALNEPITPTRIQLFEKNDA